MRSPAKCSFCGLEVSSMRGLTTCPMCDRDTMVAMGERRDPDPSRSGIFRNHNCWKCNDGAKPCVQGGPHRCDYPHARNE